MLDPGISIGIVALLIFFLSCQKQERTPKGILTTDQMVSVLSEIYVSEQKISTLGVTRDSVRQIFDVMEDKIFEKVHIPDSVFRRSLSYYMDHPKTLEMIYAALVDSLNLREQRLISRENKK